MAHMMSSLKAPSWVTLHSRCSNRVSFTLFSKKKIVFFFKTKMSNILRKSYLFNFRSILREKIKKEIKNERRVTRQKAKRRGEWNEGESRWGKMPGEGTGLWASQVCYSPKTCSFHQDGKWREDFHFLFWQLEHKLLLQYQKLLVISSILASKKPGCQPI